MRILISGIIILVNQISWAFEYDSKDLPDDLKNSSEIVIAKKMSGILGLRFIVDEIDSYQINPIDWGNSEVWERLQARNSSPSVFLVLNTIKGSLEVGEEFAINDYWIPVQLGSVQLLFLNGRDDYFDSNPCHRIGLDVHKEAIVNNSANHEVVTAYELKNNLSFCAGR